MTHDEYVKRRDEILTNLAIDMTNTTMPERMELAAEAKQAIDQLFLEMVGEKVEEYDDIVQGTAQYGKRVGYNRAKAELRTIIKGDTK